MRYRLTATVQRQIIAGIRSGGYPDVAAEAAGIPAAVFAHWLALGSGSAATPTERRFVQDVRAAAAQARLKAELDAFKDVKFWLRHGPGKETVRAAGWSTPPKAVYEPTIQENVMASPQWTDLIGLLLKALTPFPEAREALCAALAAADIDAVH